MYNPAVDITLPNVEEKRESEDKHTLNDQKYILYVIIGMKLIW